MTAPFAAEYNVQPTLTEASLGSEKDGVLWEAWEDLVSDLNHVERRVCELVSMQGSFDPAFHRYRMMMEISLLNGFGSAVMAVLGKQVPIFYFPCRVRRPPQGHRRLESSLPYCAPAWKNHQ